MLVELLEVEDGVLSVEAVVVTGSSLVFSVAIMDSKRSISSGGTVAINSSSSSSEMSNTTLPSVDAPVVLILVVGSSAEAVVDSTTVMISIGSAVLVALED